MNSTITFTWTRRLLRSFARQFYLRSLVVYLILLAILPVVLCWGCTTVITQLHGFFSNAGVVDLWYHILVSLPIALLPAICLIKLVKLVIKAKHDYTRMCESCPIHDDKEVDVEIRIDDDGIGLGKEKVRWDEMTVGLATKDFYAFQSGKPVLVGMPKYAVDAKLGEYLTGKMKTINKSCKGRLRQGDKKAFRPNLLLKWGAVWGAFFAGSLVATLAFRGANSFFAETSTAPVGSLAFVLLMAVVSAVIGPLMIVCAALAIFCVEGGTPTAICSLLMVSPLMYCALIWGFCRWWKSTSRLVKCIGWIAIVCYSAVATYCLLYGGSSI